MTNDRLRECEKMLPTHAVFWRTTHNNDKISGCVYWHCG